MSELAYLRHILHDVAEGKKTAEEAFTALTHAEGGIEALTNLNTLANINADRAARGLTPVTTLTDGHA